MLIQVNNVNEALVAGVRALSAVGIPMESRNGPTLEAPEPVVTEYRNPTQRVLLNAVRDANPFFHLMESLWILAGRNDVEWLAQFNGRMREYSDDGVTFHGAYGHRMRSGFVDQLETVVQKLKQDPDSRRAVVQIWDSELDLCAESKDMPCNDMIFFRIRYGQLDMTVCNRSNDMIWGCYGANAVHFSILQEYMAARIGVSVGSYYQVSNSFHVYTDNPQWQALKDSVYYGDFDPYKYEVSALPMVTAPDKFDEDLLRFMKWTSASRPLAEFYVTYHNEWFLRVAEPMFLAWKAHKRDKCGLQFVPSILATDWRAAADMWLRKREEV